MRPQRYNGILFPAILGIFILGGWYLVLAQGTLAKWILPTPGSILAVFDQHLPLLGKHLATTLAETVSGLLISLGVGVVTAFLMDRRKALDQAIFPYLILSQTIPIIAVAPLIIIWFGYGIQAKVFIVALVCFFPICVNLYDGFKNISVDYLRLFRSMNATPWQVFLRLKVPAALPSFFTGLKLSTSYSVMAAIIGEWLGGESGLGIYMTRAAKSYQTAQVFAIIVVISLVSLCLYGLVVLLERSLLRWRFIKQAEYLDME